MVENIVPLIPRTFSKVIALPVVRIKDADILRLLWGFEMIIFLPNTKNCNKFNNMIAYSASFCQFGES